MGRIFDTLIQRFPNRAVENAYRTDQRVRQARFTRTMTLIVGLAMLAYVVTSFVFLGTETFTAVGLANLSFVPLLLIYAWLVGTPRYATDQVIDSVFFVSVQPGMYVSIKSIVESGASGWDFSAQMNYGLLLAMAFGCLAFAASVLPYLLLILASIAYFAAVLWWHGYDGARIGYALNSYGTFAALLFYVNWAIDDKARRLFLLTRDLDAEKAKSDKLLDSALPHEIAERLRHDEQVTDEHARVAIVFADIVGFTRISKALGSKGTVDMLNRFFARADHGCELFGMEKVKTIGDCYMAVSGALTKPPRPEKAAVDFAVFLVREAHRVGEELGLDIKVRVGVNSGEMIGGVIGSMRLSYDYWGDTINVAARLQGLAEPDGVTVSEAIWKSTRDSYPYDPPRTAHLKNLGDSDVYDIRLDAEALA